MLTAADKKWIRKMVRDEIASVIAEMAVQQIGGYDGAVPYTDEDYYPLEKGGEPTHRRIGFHVPEQEVAKPV